MRSRSLLGSVLLASLAACGGGGLEDLRSDVADASVLLFVLDSAPAGHLGCYGYPRPTTPFLDRLSTESLVFRDVTAPANYTVGSVASLLTGEQVEVHRMTGSGLALSPQLPTLAEAFQAAGFRTHGYSLHPAISAAAGLDRGFDRFVDASTIVGPGEEHLLPESFFEDLDGLLSSGERFFAYYHLLPPGAPYSPPATSTQLVAGRVPASAAGRAEAVSAINQRPRKPNTAEAMVLRDLYDGGLRYVDTQLAQVDQLLASRDRRDDVLWIVTGAHGEAFGEHALYHHGRGLFQEELAVPLILRVPGGSLSGEVVRWPVSAADLFPTLTDLFGLEGSPASSHSQLPAILAGAEDERPTPVVARSRPPGEWTALRSESLKLVHKPDDTLFLYNLNFDPPELKEASRRRLDDTRALEQRLYAWRDEAQALAREPELVELDLDQRSRLEALGYGLGTSLAGGADPGD